MASVTQVSPGQTAVERFRRDLDSLVGPETPIGVAVSGGPDSLALLVLAVESRPLLVEAATVDHSLRPESRAEAEMVAALCERLGIPHRTLTADWQEKPATAVQERARAMRYRLLSGWARERGLGALVTAHHLDDQAETFVMRLARGAGVQGLAGMRRVSRTPGAPVPLVRPLLGWRRSELEAVCAAAGIEPVHDPSNDDEAYERVRMRHALAQSEWLDPQAIAASAEYLAQSDSALGWAATREWNHAVMSQAGAVLYRPTDAPREIRRRIVRRAILALASEGNKYELRGRELDQVIAALNSGRQATLRGVVCAGGEQWRFSKAPARRT